MKISPWIYLVGGVIVAIVSMYLGSKMRTFVWLGIALAVFGAVSVFILRAKPKKKEGRFVRYAVCPWCAATVRKTDRFCWNCGKQLRNI